MDVGRFREAVEYVQKAAKTLYEAAKEVFERVKVTVQRLVELFVEAVTRVLAWIDEHKAYLFLMAAAAAGAVALSAALNLWGLVELEKLAYAAVGAPFVAGLADAGGRAAERFRVVADRWRVDENEKQKIEEVINEVINAPQNRERPFLKLTSLENLPPPLAELRKALTRVKDEVEKDAAVVATLVLYKTLVKNAEAYGEWARWYRWARGLVGREEFTVATEEVKRLRGSQRRLEEVAGEVRRELNRALVLYSQSDFYKERPDLLNKLKQLLEVDLGKAEELAKARSDELSKYSNVNIGTKAYAALLSMARGGAYGHAAMLLIGEGALVDIVLSVPRGAYKKAKEIAKGRGEAVDPSRTRRGTAGWEDRATSVLLRYLLGRAVNEDLKFRRVEGGFEVFRAYGGVEAHVDALKIGEAASSMAAGEELRRFVEEARRLAPDLSGFDKAPQHLEWRATDVTTYRRQIVAATAHSWQAAWYIALLGEPKPKSFSGGANVTEEGRRPNVTMRWPREREDEILRESRWLEYLLGRRVESWRELVDAIDWSQVLERAGKLAGALKPWIGSEGASDAEREGLVGRMFSELALLVHFAEARKGFNNDEWRKERTARLAKAVEAPSSRRIKGDYAERLARLIISYAESRAESVKERIDKLAEELAGVSKEEVWGVVEFVLNDMYCLARDCARDEVVRKFVAPALELMMLDKARRGEFDREKALLIFGEMYATAVAGDGSVGPRSVMLTVGGELGGGAALLRLATLHLLNELQPDELKFDAQIYVKNGKYYIAATGGDAVRFMRLLAVSAPSAGGGYLSDKFNEFVEAARVEVRLGDVRPTKSGVAADLTLSEANIAVKYNVYLQNDIRLQFQSTDRSRVELAARLMKLAGVSAEVKRRGGRDVWYIEATTDKLAAGREELRKAIAEIVKTARKSVGEEKAKRWLEKLEKGLTLMEGWPRYHVGLKDSALEVSFGSTDPVSIEVETRRFRDMGLEEGKHFSVKMPEEGGGKGYVYILKEGLAYAAWLSVYGSGTQQELAAEFVRRVLQRAKEKGEKVYKKALEVVEEGKARGSLRFADVRGAEVEVGGRRYVVNVLGGEAELEESWSGKRLLRIKISAEVDGVRREYEMIYGRCGAGNRAVGFAYARADAPGGREADAKRLAAVIKALTGEEPRIRRMKNGKIKIECYGGHLKGFMLYTELAEAIARWLEETGRQ